MRGRAAAVPDDAPTIKYTATTDNANTSSQEISPLDFLLSVTRHPDTPTSAELSRKRKLRSGLTPAEDKKEAHLTARTMSFTYGPEVAACARAKLLREKKRAADGGFGPPFTLAEESELRGLTTLYPKPLPPARDGDSLAEFFPALHDAPMTTFTNPTDSLTWCSKWNRGPHPPRKYQRGSHRLRHKPQSGELFLRPVDYGKRPRSRHVPWLPTRTARPLAKYPPHPHQRLGHRRLLGVQLSRQFNAGKSANGAFLPRPRASLVAIESDKIPGVSNQSNKHNKLDWLPLLNRGAGAKGLFPPLANFRVAFVVCDSCAYEPPSCWVAMPPTSKESAWWAKR